MSGDLKLPQLGGDLRWRVEIRPNESFRVWIEFEDPKGDPPISLADSGWVERRSTRWPYVGDQIVSQAHSIVEHVSLASSLMDELGCNVMPVSNSPL